MAGVLTSLWLPCESHPLGKCQSQDARGSRRGRANCQLVRVQPEMSVMGYVFGDVDTKSGTGDGIGDVGPEPVMEDVISDAGKPETGDVTGKQAQLMCSFNNRDPLAAALQPYQVDSVVSSDRDLDYLVNKAVKALSIAKVVVADGEVT